MSKSNKSVMIAKNIPKNPSIQKEMIIINKLKEDNPKKKFQKTKKFIMKLNIITKIN